MPVTNKGFGELFMEAKDGLDHVQAKMASVLPSFPGQNAAKYFDLAIGIDFHPTIWPPSPIFPVPHIGMVFDIMGAIMSVIASMMPDPPPPPEAPEGEDAPPEPVTLLGVATAVVSALKPSVQVHGQWIANAGTGIQHLPGIVLHLLPLVAPMSSSEMWMGSSTVLADGGPFSTQFHPALSCNIVGFPSLFRKNKPPKPKMALMAPTSMLLCITSGGAPVLVGGPPTIDLFQLMFKMALKGMGKLWKKGANKVKELFPKNTKLGQLLQKAKCRLFGEPVDAATGRVYANNIDFELPGPIPLVWERTYYSDAEVNGPLGYNWHHSYNMGLYDMGNGFFTIRLHDGREVVMPGLYYGESFFNRSEQFWWRKDEEGYYLTNAAKLQYRFHKDIRNADGYQPLVSITDHNGFIVQLNYNHKGWLTRIVDSCGRKLQVENDDAGRVIHIHTIANNRTINLIAYEYDAAGNMRRVADAAGAEKLFYYEGHLLVKLTNQSGMSFYWEYEGKGNDAKCIHTWGDDGVLEYWTQYEPGKTTTRNSLGHSTEYYYNEKKLIHKIIDANGGITHQVYNHFDELVVTVNPEGGSIQYHYNDFGLLTRSINENGEATVYQYDERLNLTGVSSPGGMSAGWKYDEQDRAIERKGVDGNTIFYEYEGPYLRRISDQKKRAFLLEYDMQHNLTQLTFPDELKQQWGYDDMGNLLTATDIRGNNTRYRYNDAGNIVWVKEPDGSEHELAYDVTGNLVKASGNNQEVQFTYGPLGIVTSRQQNNQRVSFAYDAELQLRSIANEGGEVYKFGLDAVGNVVSEWGFDGLHRRYLRDGNGQVRKVLRPAEKWTQYEYDSTGNVVKEEHSDGSLTAYRYNKDGLLAEAFNEESHIALQRDKMGRVVKEIQNGYEVKKEYDEDGNCIFIGSSLGANIQMQYDAFGLLQQLKAAGPSQSNFWEASWIRDNTGLETQRQLSGGVSVQTERDALGRVVRRSIGALNMEQSRTRYEWGRGHKLQRIVNELNKAKASFEYDGFENLISASYEEKGVTETIYRTPDRIGNLFKSPDRSDRKYGKGGQLQQDETFNYHYDAEGNLVFKEFRINSNLNAEDKTGYAQERKITLAASATGWAYEWAANGMLQKVVNPSGGEVSFHYDPLGRRIAKQHKGMVTRWLWNGNTPLHEWRYKGEFPPHSSVTESGEVEAAKEPVENLLTWVFEEGGFVPCAKIEGDTQYSIVTDYLGTPTHAYDHTGAPVWERQLDCYGKVRHLQGNQTFCPYLYQGQYVDGETGLAYNRFRYYDAESGNYISQDPIGLHGGNPTLYGYSRNPYYYLDPLGLAFWKPLKDTGMGHHPIPRSHANAHGMPELGTEYHSPSWYPNEVDGSDVLHRNMHQQVKDAGVPFNRPFTGTRKELLEKIRTGYTGLDQKGFLKIPATGEIIARDITIKDAVDEQLKWTIKQRREKARQARAAAHSH
jgi:RHS repeat-associated protein